MKILFLTAMLLLLIYILLVSPRIFKRPDMSKYKNAMIAHRGLFDNQSDAPENSMKAFANAVEAGLGIEMDVQLSKDGIPVVFHDFTLDRVCGIEGKVCEYTYEELSKLRLCGSEETIPKFEDVLRLVDGKVPLIVEYKVNKMSAAVCAASDRLLKDYSGVYCMESFHPLALFWYRKNRPDVARGQLSDAFLRRAEFEGQSAGGRVILFILTNLWFNILGRPDFIAFNKTYPNTFSRNLLKKVFHIPQAAWTIQSPDELNRAKNKFDIYIFDGFMPGRAEHV